MRLPNFSADSALTDAGGRGTDSFRLFLDSVQKWIRGNGTNVYGTAAQRTTKTTRGFLDSKNLSDGTLYTETDTGLMYQLRAGAWVEVGQQAGLAQIAYATAGLTLGLSAQNIVGATITLTRAGTHLIRGVFSVTETGAGDVGIVLIGQLSADAVVQTQDALFISGAAGGAATVSQQWLYTAPSPGKSVKLVAWKPGGTGTSTINPIHTSISAQWISP